MSQQFWTTEENDIKAQLYFFLLLPTLSSSHQSALSGSFIHPPHSTTPPPPFVRSSLHNKPFIFHMIPPGTFPSAPAAALTLDLLARPRRSNPEQAGRRAGIIVQWPAFSPPTSHHQVFKSAQVSHQRVSQYEERRIITKMSAV